MTGKSIPVPKTPGSSVVAGSVNTTGALKVQVTRRVEDNTINRIIHMVEEAQATKAPTARLIDRFSRYYTPIAILIAALTMVLPPMAFGADWSTWFYRGFGSCAGRLPVRARALDTGRHRVGACSRCTLRSADQGRRGTGSHRQRSHGRLR